MKIKLFDMGTTGLETWVFQAKSRRAFRLRKGRAAAIIRKRYNYNHADAFNRLIEKRKISLLKY